MGEKRKHPFFSNNGTLLKLVKLPRAFLIILQNYPITRSKALFILLFYEKDRGPLNFVDSIIKSLILSDTGEKLSKMV